MTEAKVKPRKIVILTSLREPRPEHWEPEKKLPARRVDAITRARMALEHTGVTGAAA